MRADNAAFVIKNEEEVKRPLYAVQVSADLANTDTFWLTSSKKCETPSGATVIPNILTSISGTSQRIDPIKAIASIGAINFSAIDPLGTLLSTIKTKLDGGDGLRHKRIRVYVGYEGLDWDDYALIQTQIIREISFSGVTHTFACADIQRSARKNIFDNKKDNLKYDVDDSQTAITVYGTTDFETVFHGTSYSDAPSSTVGYVKIEDEKVRWLSKVETAITDTGTDISFSGSNITSTSTDLSVFADKQMIVISGSTSNDGTYFINGTPTTTNITVTGTFATEGAGATINVLAEIQFYNITRGVLNTKAVEHTVDSTADSDKRTGVEEYIYLQIPAIKLLYAILTGILYGDLASLPDHWHLNISTDFVSTASFVGIGDDWWDTTDDLLGFPSSFNGEEKIDGKAFYEKELLLLIGGYLSVLSDGQLALRRMNRTLSNSPYLAVLDNSNVERHGALKHDMGALHNQFKIKWNWDTTQEKLTRNYILIDNDSISKHGAAPVLEMSFRGMDGSNHTQAALAVRTDSARDRYAGPPLVSTVDCLHHMNKYEVGDILRDNVPGVKDFNTGADIDRSMEIQQVRTDWITGRVIFDLFGSSQSASSQSYTELSTVLNDSFYGSGSGGTDISTVTTGSDIGGTWHISGNSTLTGNADMNAAGAIFYYEGGVQNDSGITLTINSNVQIRARDGFTNNGDIDGIGNGIVASTSGTAGMFNTKATGGMVYSSTSLGSGYAGVGNIDSEVLVGSPLSYYTLENEGATLTGIPSELRGSSGADGGDIIEKTTTVASGGVGGAGGAGLCIITRGFSSGASGEINLDGAIGTAGASRYVSDVKLTLNAGSGGGGAPGGLLILLDGAAATESGVANSFSALIGETPDIGAKAEISMSGFYNEYWKNRNRNLHSYYEGFPQTDLGESAYRVQYIPANEIPAEDVPETTSPPTAISIQEAVATNNSINTVVLELSATPPADGNFRGSMIYIKLDGTNSWQQVGEARLSEEIIFYVPANGATYNVKAHGVSIFGKESPELFGPVDYTVATAQEAVFGPDSKIKTSTTTGEPTSGEGIEIDDTGITGYDTSGNVKVKIDAATGLITATDAVLSGTITALAGAIGGWDINATTIESTNNRVILDSGNQRIQVQNAAGTNYVRMDANGIVGVDSTLGTVFDIPTDGSAPTFASGIINSTIYNISTSGILRTSETVGDGGANGDGVLINNTGVKGFKANDATPVFFLDSSDGSISAFDATLTGGGITLSAGGNIKGGQTAYATGTGFFLGYESAAYKFSIGSSDSYMRWTGAEMELRSAAITGQAIDINPGGDDTIHVYARNDTAGTYENLVTLGNAALSINGAIADFGSNTADNNRIAVWAESYKHVALHAESNQGNAIDARTANSGAIAVDARNTAGNAIYGLGGNVGGYGVLGTNNQTGSFGVKGSANFGYALYGDTISTTLAPLLLDPQGSVAPTHTAAEGSIYPSTNGLYYNDDDSTGWGKFVIDQQMTIQASGTQSISNTTWTPSVAGIYNIVLYTGSGDLEEGLFVTSWRYGGFASVFSFASDGTNMRLREAGTASVTIAYQRVA